MIWRKSRISLKLLTGFLILLCMVVIFLEKTAIISPHPFYDTKIEAAKKMEEGIQLLSNAIKNENPDSIDLIADPNQTGFIGMEYTQLTTTLGSIISKRTSTNPDFVALIIDLLLKAGVKKGDHVAIGVSSSFPALNLAVILAVEAIEGEPVLISSIGASTWGANRINWTWLDMERLFYEHGIINHRSIVVSLGGGNDQGEGFWGDGLNLAHSAIDRDQIPFLESDNLIDSIERRLKMYQEYDPVLFINVGGAHPNMGNCSHSVKIQNGLIERIIPCFHPDRGLILRFLEKGLPVVNLLNIPDLAIRYGLPIDPIPLPEPGYSKVYFHKKYLTFNIYLSLLIILTYIVWGIYYERRRNR